MFLISWFIYRQKFNNKKKCILPISVSSRPDSEDGTVFRLYLSLIESPGLFLVQNLLVWSLLPLQSMCPIGCQARVHTILSWACSIAPTSFSALKKYINTIRSSVLSFVLFLCYPKEEPTLIGNVFTIGGED